ncbi:MAG: amidohydrolase family protein [Chloroflexaceae bacterium]|nr:amidohydrolase family protein [Chloroflexaceae bacterium]
MIDLIIHNATVVNADGRQAVDIAVHQGKIVAIGHGSALPDASEHVDAGGLFLLPGVIDSHVHIREPGRTEREDFATATRAAAVSGVTMVCEMPISSPSVHNPQILANRIAAV